MPLAIIGRGAELLREDPLSRIGVDPSERQVPAQVVGLGANDPKCAEVVVEGTHRQSKELLLLGVIQDPAEILVDRKEGDQRGRLDNGEGLVHECLCTAEIALVEEEHDLP